MQETMLDLARWLVITVWRDGGQRGARRNAWAAMVDDNVRARDRAEAELALRRVQPEASSVARG
jgi:hypothetical protein